MEALISKMREVINMIFLSSILIILMLVSAIAAILFKSLLNSVVATGMVSLIAAGLFYYLQAPDVAMAEAIIGAGLTTAIFIITLIKTEWGEEK